VLFSFFFSLLAMAAKILFRDFYLKFYTDRALVTLPTSRPVVQWYQHCTKNNPD